MLFSLVVCTYNTPKELLERALSSFNGLKNQDLELILINDGSDELHALELLSLIDEALFEFEFKLFNIENIGLSAARNYGMQKSTGKYIGFMDSDDYYFISDAFYVLSTLEKDFDLIDFSIETVINYNSKRKVINPDMTLSTNDEVLCYFNSLLKKNKYFAPAPYKVYLRSYLMENKLFFYEGIFHEDEEWMPRIFFSVSKLKVSSVVSYRHYQTTSSSITRSQNPFMKKKRAVGLLTATNSMIDLSGKMKGELRSNFRNYIAKTYLQIPIHSSDIKLNRLLPLKFSNESSTFIKSMLFLFGNRFYLWTRAMIKG